MSIESRVITRYTDGRDWFINYYVTATALTTDKAIVRGATCKWESSSRSEFYVDSPIRGGWIVTVKGPGELRLACTIGPSGAMVSFPNPAS